MAASGKDAEPNREPLDEIKDRDQDKLEQEQAVAPLDAALSGGDNAADVGIGKHDDHTGAEDGEGVCEADSGARLAERGANAGDLRRSCRYCDAFAIRT
jgi:hypothetical protein